MGSYTSSKVAEACSARLRKAGDAAGEASGVWVLGSQENIHDLLVQAPRYDYRIPEPDMDSDLPKVSEFLGMATYQEGQYAVGEISKRVADGAGAVAQESR